LTDIPEANDDIDAVATFPKETDVSAGFPSKHPMKILLGFRNNGDVPVKVTHIAGSLNVPQMFSFYVTNFTVQSPFTTVEPGKEASFEYPFVLDPQLAGHEFVLAVTAFYKDETETFASTFYNATISVLDPVGVFDTQTFVVKLVLLALALGVAYLGVAAAGALPAAEKALKKVVGSGKKKAVKKETGTKKVDAANNEWLKGTSWKEGKSQ
jgi:translocon-associated protein subunit alpha